MSEWRDFGCDGGIKQWRYLPDNRIEINDEGIVILPWRKDVDQWRQLINAKAAKYKIAPAWIAAIMALESGGVPGLCYKLPTKQCSDREGVGLMAMLRSTAEYYAGRAVTQEELLSDYDFQVDLGAKLIAELAVKSENDFVRIGVAYNAGKVKCGDGNTWALPKEPCAPTDWGVVMGCLRVDKPINKYCQPSKLIEGKYVCPNDYPRTVIGLYNQALAQDYALIPNAEQPLQPPPKQPQSKEPAQASATGGTPAGYLLSLAVGATIGYFATTRLLSSATMKRYSVSSG